ncbi:MAG: NAD(P)/FAD-dependent oxidoreductase [Anaerolineae bacterium]|nr:NAD(P)/FAD-dependent oxidoreductase [Anaerolineae bacterium]
MHIAIIGAGAAGLAAAWDLAREGHRVTIYEAGAEVGGLAAGFKAPAWDWSLEKFYHHWFETDTDILALIDEIGHSEKVLFPWPTTSIWSPDGTFAVDKPRVASPLLSRVLNVLSIPGLSLIDKLRFGLAGFALTKYHNGIALESHTAESWLRRWVGARAYEIMWRPLLIGKFGALYDRVNMAWMWARLYKRTARLGTYQGGFQAMLEDLAEAVRGAGATIQLDTPVEALRPAEGGGITLRVGGQETRYDRVLSTVGPGLMLRLAPDLPEAYQAQIRALRSTGAVVVVLALDRQLMTDGTYWLNLPASSPEKSANPFPFLALVEHTNYVSPEHFNGEHIVYLGDYVDAQHEYFTLSEDELAARFIAALPQVNPAFSPDWIRTRWVFRVPYAQPVPFVNHSAHIPAVNTPLDGLYWASMSQVYPWDRGTNYAVEIGRRTARMMLDRTQGS